MLVEKKYLDGKFVKYGAILAASISNQGKTFAGFRFENESGKAEYYDAKGTSLKKSFLKSPLRFARISSRFSSARLHPVLKIVRPHLGVDYAAPTGTPVVAVASGTVVLAGPRGQGGKTVRLRHAGGCESMYLHLSRIAVRPGARVEQGEIVGTGGFHRTRDGTPPGFSPVAAREVHQSREGDLPAVATRSPSAFRSGSKGSAIRCRNSCRRSISERLSCSCACVMPSFSWCC